jgi:hypothetical protein
VAGTLSRLRPADDTRLADFELEPQPSAAAPRLARPIVVVHALTLAAAFGGWAYLDRNLWFFGDEWDFLTRRGLHGAYFSIWAPHNEHWSVLPILLWRGIYSAEHLSSYWPYLVPLLLAHVLVVHLLWRRCLREGADPWVATALALLFALLGAGAEDLAWAFQIGFVSAVLFGLLSMEVAEGPPSAGDAPFALATFQGPVAWRDVAASLLVLAAVMCSMVGVAAGVALGVLLLGRFGWQRALRALAMPAAVFLTWFALAGHSGLKATGDYLGTSVFDKIPKFVGSNLAADIGKAGSTLQCLAARSPRLCSTRLQLSGATASAQRRRRRVMPTSGSPSCCRPSPWSSRHCATSSAGGGSGILPGTPKGVTALAGSGHTFGSSWSPRCSSRR